MTSPQDATITRQGGRFPRGLRALRAGGLIGATLLTIISLACLLTLPWTLGSAPGGEPRYRAQNLAESRQGPSWAGSPEVTKGEASAPRRTHWFGADALGRDLLARCLAGGALSLGVGAAAALLSVVLGTIYGMTAGFVGGRLDAVMMRIVDVLYGLPYILLVVLLSVAGSALADAREAREVRTALAARSSLVQELLRPHGQPMQFIDPAVARAKAESIAAAEFPMPPASRGRTARVLLLIGAIGGVSWLTMARVVRGQTLSLRAQPFVESARAIGASPARILLRHILPNLAAPIVVYATLTAPQAILQESFLSFLGIGIPAPLPSWGNLVADGLGELNTVKSRWWLLLFPCVLLTATLLSMNLLGEALRARLDPRARRA